MATAVTWKVPRDERLIWIDTKTGMQEVPRSRFVQQYVSEKSAGCITETSKPVINAARTQASFQFTVADLLPAGYHFCTKLTFDTSKISGDGKMELWVVDPAGNELLYNPANPASGPTVKPGDLVAGSEIHQLVAIARDLAKLDGLPRIREDMAFRTFERVDRRGVDKDGNPYQYQRWALRSRVALDAGLAGGEMWYAVDTQLASGFGHLRARPAYITYLGTPASPIATPCAIQDATEVSTRDRAFILPYVVKYFDRIGQFHADMAAYKPMVNGIAKQVVFVPNHASPSWDPHDRFSLAIPNQHLGRSDHQMVLEPSGTWSGRGTGACRRCGPRGRLATLRAGRGGSTSRSGQGGRRGCAGHGNIFSRPKDKKCSPKFLETGDR